MPGTRKVSERQWELLLRFMEINPAIAKGSIGNEGPLAKINTTAKWSNIAARLNSEGAGCTKSHSKWREYWNQQKYNARKKASGLRQQALATGGGPLPAKFVLNDRDERILALLGHVAVYREPSVRIPFPVREDNIIFIIITNCKEVVHEVVSGDNAAPWPTCSTSPAVAPVAAPAHPFLEVYESESPSLLLPPCSVPLPMSDQSILTLPPTPSPPQYTSPPRYPSPLPPPPPPPSPPPPDSAAVMMATPTTGATRGRGRIRRGRRSDPLPLAQDALRRPYHRVTPAAPDWVFHLEERSLVTERGIAAALQELNATLHGMREAMESVAQSLQGITRQLDS